MKTIQIFNDFTCWLVWNERMLAHWTQVSDRCPLGYLLDDGLGGDRNYQKAIQSSYFVRESIQEFGFLLAEETREWKQKLQITWLGYFMWMGRGKFFTSEDRIKRLELSAKSMLCQLVKQELRIVLARFAASVAGQIISMQMVLGKIVRLRTRQLYKCIYTRLELGSSGLYIWKSRTRS